MGSGASVKHPCQAGIQKHHCLENLTAAYIDPTKPSAHQFAIRYIKW